MNNGINSMGLQVQSVLIDTWWNVNLSRPPIMILVVPSFNRYMVECEFNPANPRILPFCVLIDTWWNVNLDISIFEEKCNTRFNRYMVECECYPEDICEDF